MANTGTKFHFKWFVDSSDQESLKTYITNELYISDIIVLVWHWQKIDIFLEFNAGISCTRNQFSPINVHFYKVLVL